MQREHPEFAKRYVALTQNWEKGLGDYGYLRKWDVLNTDLVRFCTLPEFTGLRLAQI